MSSEIGNKQGCLIRKMTPADIPVVVAMEKEIFPDPWSENIFTEQLEEPNWGALVAESQSGIIGYACYYVAIQESHLTNIATLPEYRRKSVAKQLLENILTIVTEKGCEFLLLEVRPSNTAAIEFYKRYGFKYLYSRPGYYQKPKEDAWVMVKYFD